MTTVDKKKSVFSKRCEMVKSNSTTQHIYPVEITVLMKWLLENRFQPQDCLWFKMSNEMKMIFEHPIIYIYGLDRKVESNFNLSLTYTTHEKRAIDVNQIRAR